MSLANSSSTTSSATRKAVGQKYPPQNVNAPGATGSVGPAKGGRAAASADPVGGGSTSRAPLGPRKLQRNTHDRAPPASTKQKMQKRADVPTANRFSNLKPEQPSSAPPLSTPPDREAPKVSLGESSTKSETRPDKVVSNKETRSRVERHDKKLPPSCDMRQKVVKQDCPGHAVQDQVKPPELAKANRNARTRTSVYTMEEKSLSELSKQFTLTVVNPPHHRPHTHPMMHELRFLVYDESVKKKFLSYRNFLKATGRVTASDKVALVELGGNAAYVDSSNTFVLKPMLDPRDEIRVESMYIALTANASAKQRIIQPPLGISTKLVRRYAEKDNIPMNRLTFVIAN